MENLVVLNIIWSGFLRLRLSLNFDESLKLVHKHVIFPTNPNILNIFKKFLQKCSIIKPRFLLVFIKLVKRHRLNDMSWHNISVTLKIRGLSVLKRQNFMWLFIKTASSRGTFKKWKRPTFFIKIFEYVSKYKLIIMKFILYIFHDSMSEISGKISSVNSKLLLDLIADFSILF